MDFEALIRSRAIEPVDMGDREIAGLLMVSERDVRASASMVDTDLDWAFAIAYNGILQASIAYMGYVGYRPRGEGKHFNTFRFIEQALPDHSATIRRLQRLRRKRNAAIYEQSGLVSEQEAHDVIEFAAKYCDLIESLMPSTITDLISRE